MKKDISKVTELVKTLLWLGFGVDIHPSSIYFIKDEVESSLEKINPKRTVIKIRRLSKNSYKRIRRDLERFL